MTKAKQQGKPWAKPDLKRLGTISDVRGTQNVNPQTGNSKS